VDTYKKNINHILIIKVGIVQKTIARIGLYAKNQTKKHRKKLLVKARRDAEAILLSRTLLTLANNK